MTFFAALLIALSALFNTGAQAPITAPSQALTFEAPKVGTVPAPKAPEAPAKALSQAPVQAPTHAPTQAPACMEDMPCWDCSTMGNKVCGNASPQAPVDAPCMEDMPCWDCKTMGNLICGPVATEAPVQPVPVDEAHRWADKMFFNADMELTPNVTLVFTNTANCGAELSTVGKGGCTYTTAANTYTIVMSPELAWTPEGQHILFHELGHTLGMGECEAEVYSHQFEEVELWSYPACNV